MTYSEKQILTFLELATAPNETYDYDVSKNELLRLGPWDLEKVKSPEDRAKIHDFIMFESFCKKVREQGFLYAAESGFNLKRLGEIGVDKKVVNEVRVYRRRMVRRSEAKSILVCTAHELTRWGNAKKLTLRYSERYDGHYCLRDELENAKTDVYLWRKEDHENGHTSVVRDWLWSVSKELYEQEIQKKR
jgi:hypothetical protein